LAFFIILVFLSKKFRKESLSLEFDLKLNGDFALDLLSFNLESFLTDVSVFILSLFVVIFILA